MTSLYRYSYYDTPDGKDLHKKLVFAAKNVSILGFGLATSEIILISKPIGYLNTLYRYGQLMGPMYAAAASFCTVTYVSTKLREKDDEMNYAIGGFTTGIFTGALIKRYMFGTWMGVSFAIAGAVKKYAKLNDIEFFPVSLNRKSIHGDFYTPYRNWTIYDQRPKGWIAAEERKE